MIKVVTLFLNNNKIMLSESAIDKLLSIKKQFLLVSVKGGGCSGYEYVFKLSENKPDNFLSVDSCSFNDTNQSDSDILNNNINLKNFIELKKHQLIAIGKSSINLIKNSIINYKIDIMGSKFEIVNPNAMDVCSCGKSFEV